MTHDDWLGIEEAVAVRFNGSFTAAARQLGISTSQISRTIAELERRVQTPIFVRTTRSLRPTDAGRALIDQFTKLIELRREILASAAGTGTPQGTLRITSPLLIGERFVSPIIQSFAQEFPALDVTIDFRNRIVDLINENYDLGIRTGDTPDDRLIRTKLAARRISTVASPAFLKSHGAPESPDQIKHFQCVIAGAPIWHFVVEGKEIAIRPKGRWRSNSSASAVAATIAGFGICQMPEECIAAPVKAGELVRILENFRPPDEPVWAVYPRQSHLEPKVRMLVDRLRRELGEAFAGELGK